MSLAVSGPQDTFGDGVDTLINIEALTGSSFDDTLTGGNTPNTLSGGAGNDTLDSSGGLQQDWAGQAFRLYEMALGRGPDVGGFDFWINQLRGGLSLEAAAGGFTGSPEFQVTYGALDNTQFVTLLYNNALHRAPDPGGLAFWVNLLSAGTSRNDVVLGFSESAEEQGNQRAGLQDFIQNMDPSQGNVLDGGSGTDTVSYASASGGLSGEVPGVAAGIVLGVTVSLAVSGPQETFAAGVDTLINIANLTGSAFKDTLTGDGNANVLVGGAGNDTLFGGAGDDTLVGGTGRDLLSGSSGNDIASYRDADIGVTASLANPGVNKGDAVGDTYQSIEGLEGSAFGDTLIGNAFNNSLRGGGGADALNGGDGNDTYIFTGPSTISTGDDVIFDSSGADVIVVNSLAEITSAQVKGDLLIGLPTGSIRIVDHFNGHAVESIRDTSGAQMTLATGSIGGDGSGIIAGGNGGETLDGKGGDDFLFGGNGSDRLIGGDGNDRLTGGNGENTFVFGPGFGNDIITDFTHADRIEFDGGVFQDFQSVQSASQQVGNDTVITAEMRTIRLRFKGCRCTTWTRAISILADQQSNDGLLAAGLGLALPPTLLARTGKGGNCLGVCRDVYRRGSCADRSVAGAVVADKLYHQVLRNAVVIRLISAHECDRAGVCLIALVHSDIGVLEVAGIAFISNSGIVSRLAVSLRLMVCNLPVCRRVDRQFL